jgi:MOSC domain-containing protein YiiM
MSATVVALHLSHASRAPLDAVASARALPDRGLEGDRHAKPGSRRSVLVVEQEVLDHFGLAPGDIREQVTVRGLDLNALAAGTRLAIGTAVLEVAGPCAPCERMDELRPGLRAQLEGRRGRFVRVLEAGTVAVGDAIRVRPPA